MSRALLSSLALLFALACGVAPARAQDAPAEGTPSADPALDASQAEAQALFRRGVELGEQDRWAEALEHFRRSRAIAARPNTVFNIAYANHRLSRFREAIPGFDEYLALTEGETSDRRDEAMRLRGEAVASLAEIRLALEPADARLLVDGDAHEGTGAVRVITLDPGRHTLRATSAGHDEGTLTLSVLAGERGERRMVLVPTASEAPPPPPPGGNVFDDPVFWVVVGAVVVATGVALGVGLGVASSGEQDRYGGSTGVVLDALRF